MRKSKNSCRKSVNNETDSHTRSVSILLKRKSAMNTASIVRYTVLPGVLPTMACREVPWRGEQALGVQKGRISRVEVNERIGKSVIQMSKVALNRASSE